MGDARFDSQYVAGNAIFDDAYVEGVEGDSAVTLPSLVVSGDGDSISNVADTVITLPSLVVSGIGEMVVEGDSAIALPSLVVAARGGLAVDYNIILGDTNYEIRIK